MARWIIKIDQVLVEKYQENMTDYSWERRDKIHTSHLTLIKIPLLAKSVEVQMSRLGKFNQHEKKYAFILLICNS